MLKTTNRTIIVIGGLSVLGLIISLFAHFESRFPGDLPVSLFLQSIHSELLLNIMKAVSYATGGWRAAVLVIAGGFIFWRYAGRLEAGLIALSGLVTLINEAFKALINRPRPEADLVSVFVAETGKSFPSGHAFFAIVVFGMMAYLAVTREASLKSRILTLLSFLVFILLVGASRIYLGVHWTSDVIGGYVIGSPFLVTLIWFYRISKPRPLSHFSFWLTLSASSLGR